MGPGLKEGGRGVGEGEGAGELVFVFVIRDPGARPGSLRVRNLGNVHLNLLGKCGSVRGGMRMDF